MKKRGEGNRLETRFKQAFHVGQLASSSSAMEKETIGTFAGAGAKASPAACQAEGVLLVRTVTVQLRH